MQYVYPPSPNGEDASGPPSPTQGPVPLSQRLRLLQAEVAALEVELSDPTNPLLRQEKETGNADPGELIRGMVDVKRRIEKIKKEREGRGKLVSVVLGDTTDAEDDDVVKVTAEDKEEGKADSEEAKKMVAAPQKPKEPQARDIAEMDRRVGELEKLVGSSNAALDEVRPCSSCFSLRRSSPLSCPRFRLPFFLS